MAFAPFLLFREKVRSRQLLACKRAHVVHCRFFTNMRLRPSGIYIVCESRVEAKFFFVRAGRL